jgi:S-adenosylmethionine hydrolase
MIALFTDFGLADPYVGQMHAVLADRARAIPVIDLLHAVPSYSVKAGAYLLPAFVNEFPENTVFVCVVDPGVGGSRRPVIVKASRRWFVGPDNGLFEMLVRRDADAETFVIDWRPERLSSSFHGRDLFAPVGAMLATGQFPRSTPATLEREQAADWPDDLAEVVFVDHYGNAMTGIRADTVADNAVITIRGKYVEAARTFSDVSPGQIFWYENASGLIEIAMNRASAAQALSIEPGESFGIT